MTRHTHLTALSAIRVLMLLLVITQPACLLAAERNIIFFITDDESPTLGCYGDPIAVTPHIDAMAADGTRFTNAFATTASCSAGRAPRPSLAPRSPQRPGSVPPKDLTDRSTQFKSTTA